MSTFRQALENYNATLDAEMDRVQDERPGISHHMAYMIAKQSLRRRRSHHTQRIARLVAGDVDTPADAVQEFTKRGLTAPGPADQRRLINA